MRTPGILPNQLGIAPLKRISPSCFLSLKECSLREVWSQGHAALLPPWPASRVGTVAHKLIELAGRGELVAENDTDLEKTWNKLIEEAEQRMAASWLERPLLPLSRSVHDFEVRRQRAFNRAREFTRPQGHVQARLKSDDDKTGAGFERWVQSTDGKVGGKIDQVMKVDEGILLRDYKTGYILQEHTVGEERQLKESYQIQLKLYAALYHSTQGKWPVALQVIPMEGSPQDVPFTPAESAALLAEARGIIDDLNRSIDQLNAGPLEERNLLQIASPSAKACRYCPFRPACPA